MASTIQTSQTYARGLVTGMPVVPNLLTMAWFGTGGDANEGNRASGGAALLSVGPVAHGTNSITVGNINMAGTAASINTQVLRSAAIIASGWTWAVCSRQNSAAVNVAECIGDAVHQVTLNDSALQLYSGGAQITVNCNTTLRNFHIVAGTYSGGARGVFTLYELTDGIAPQSWTRTVDVNASATDTVRLGNPTAGQFDDDPTDCAWAMISASPMSQGALTSLAASVRSFLARRGISA